MRVLMLGPGAGVMGGITTLVEAIVPEVQRRTELLYVPTVERRPLRESGRLSAGNVARAASQYARFTRAVLRFRPDVVHLHTSHGIAWLKDTPFIFAGKRCRCGVVVHMHSSHFEEVHARAPRLVQAYTRRALAAADVIVTVSDAMRSAVARVAPGSRTETLRNCIAGEGPSPARARRGAGPPVALFVGTVGRSKGAFDLLDALALLRTRGPDLQARIAGYEEERGDLDRARARARALGLTRCEILGSVGRERMRALLRDASVFVLPSHAEGLPMSVLEAMSAGLPVVATPVGGIPEVVRDGENGFLVPPGDASALAERLAALASDAGLCERMGRRSREIVDRELEVTPYVARLVELYRSLCR